MQSSRVWTDLEIEWKPLKENHHGIDRTEEEICIVDGGVGKVL